MLRLGCMHLWWSNWQTGFCCSSRRLYGLATSLILYRDFWLAVLQTLPDSLSRVFRCSPLLPRWLVLSFNKRFCSLSLLLCRDTDIIVLSLPIPTLLAIGSLQISQPPRSLYCDGSQESSFLLEWIWVYGVGECKVMTLSCRLQICQLPCLSSDLTW